MIHSVGWHPRMPRLFNYKDKRYYNVSIIVLHKYIPWYISLIYLSGTFLLSKDLSCYGGYFFCYFTRIITKTRTEYSNKYIFIWKRYWCRSKTINWTTMFDHSTSLNSSNKPTIPLVSLTTIIQCINRVQFFSDFFTL